MAKDDLRYVSLEERHVRPSVYLLLAAAEGHS